MKIIHHRISGFNPVFIPNFHKHTIQKALPIVATVAGAYFGGPIGAAAANGAANKLEGNSWGDSLKSAGLTYAGSELGSSLIGDKLGTVGSAFGNGANVENSLANLAGNFLGEDSANALGATVANTSIGSLAGGYAGNSLADSMKPAKMDNPAGPTPFSPSRQGQADLPSSLQSFGSLDPGQQASNIATQGVYGAGEGPQEASYFNNLINRRLVDDSGNVGDISSIQPIEQSYLQKLGLGGYSNSKDLLEAMSKWKAA